MHTKAAHVAETLATAHETRRQWAALTDSTRRMALAADSELRRRHPEAKLPLLSPVAAETAPEIQPSTPEAESNAAGHAGTQNLADLASADISEDTQQRLATIVERAERAQQQIDYLASLPRSAADDHSTCLGTAWEVSVRRQRDTIIQPPKPDITPAAAVLQRSQGRTPEPEPEMEAG